MTSRDIIELESVKNSEQFRVILRTLSSDYDVCFGSAGDVEVHHTLRFTVGGKRLMTPTATVRSKVAKNSFHNVWEECLESSDSEIKHVSVDLGTVNFRVVPLYTIRGLFGAEFIEHFQQFFIAADIILLNQFLNSFIILNPQNNVPGFIIGPTVVGGIGEAGLVGCGCHLVGLFGMNQL